MKTLCVIHHTHTDVSYTELQSRVARRHADFIRQALSNVLRPHEIATFEIELA